MFTRADTPAVTCERYGRHASANARLSFCCRFLTLYERSAHAFFVALKCWRMLMSFDGCHFRRRPPRCQHHITPVFANAIFSPRCAKICARFDILPFSFFSMTAKRADTDTARYAHSTFPAAKAIVCHPYCRKPAAATSLIRTHCRQKTILARFFRVYLRMAHANIAPSVTTRWLSVALSSSSSFLFADAAAIFAATRRRYAMKMPRHHRRLHAFSRRTALNAETTTAHENHAIHAPWAFRPDDSLSRGTTSIDAMRPRPAFAVVASRPSSSMLSAHRLISRRPSVRAMELRSKTKI